MDPQLYKAAMSGDNNCVAITITNLTSQKTPSNSTALHVATEFNQLKVVKAVILACPSILQEQNSDGDTALHLAAREGYTEIVKYITASAKTQTNDIESGEIEAHKKLIRMENNDKDTALHCALRRGKYQTVELLVNEDPEVCNLVNNFNESPLYLAVASGFYDVPQLIISAAPSASSSSSAYTGPKGLTALHASMYFKTYPLDKVEALVNFSPEMINKGDDLKWTPLHYAAAYDVDAKGESSLHIAASRGHIKVMKKLTELRPDSCGMVDHKGRTALHAAVLGEQVKAVKFILETPEFARNVNKPDNDGNTPLHLATLHKLHEIIQILASNKKVDLSAANKEFFTALNIYNMHNEEGIKASRIRLQLKDSKGVQNMHRWANAIQERMNREPETEKPSDSAGNRRDNDNNEEHTDVEKNNALEVNLLVTTLVATVTFAAGFTMPGGYVNEGSDEGMATLATKAAFKAFVVFNTTAFCCSIFAVLLQFHTSLTDYRQRLRYMGMAAFFTTIAILAMVLAFASGSYVVLAKSIGLAITPYAITGLFGFLYFAVPFLDPGVEGFTSLRWPQKQVRNFVIKYIKIDG